MHRFFVFSLLILLIPRTVFADCSDANLNADDKKLLEQIAKKEDAAKSVQNILAWTPVVNVLTAGGSLQAFYVATTTDFASHAKAIGSMGQIKSCIIDTDLQLYLLDMSGTDPGQCRRTFFEKLQEMYSKGC